MKKYKQLLSFGCSFTEGGGLNTTEYHHKLNKFNGIDVNDEDYTYGVDDYYEYMNEHSYPSFLAKSIGCEFYNYGISCGSNEIIIKTVYDVINGGLDFTHPLYNRFNLSSNRFIDENDYEKTFVTVQFSFMDRIMLYLNDKSKFVTLNGWPYDDDIVNEFYSLYATYFYYEHVEFKKALQYMNMCSTYLNSKKIDHIFTFYDIPFDITLIESKNLAIFDSDLHRFSKKNKLNLIDVEGLGYINNHFSVYGNEIIANRLYQHICKYYT